MCRAFMGPGVDGSAVAAPRHGMDARERLRWCSPRGGQRKSEAASPEGGGKPWCQDPKLSALSALFILLPPSVPPSLSFRVSRSASSHKLCHPLPRSRLTCCVRGIPAISVWRSVVVLFCFTVFSKAFHHESLCVYFTSFII
ncbi:hypothetical protein E2C01_049007 [Portunus trituberculatus]|uniref:Uncharacterized protein n=1 Tax=Portunus trituberculatus TaxID=210409 RepID=A0A5B7GEV9_PORTR|nr:hypothetical protein [Portunus trituberculatus]